MATSFSGGRSWSTGENHNHGQATGKLYHLRLRVECTLFCHIQSRARTHTILVTGLYELLGNPTTKLIEPHGPFPLPLSNRKYNIIKEKIGLKLCQKYIVHYFNMSWTMFSTLLNILAQRMINITLIYKKYLFIKV